MCTARTRQRTFANCRADELAADRAAAANEGITPVAPTIEALRELADGRVRLIQYDAHCGHYVPRYDPVEQERFRTQARDLGHALFARCGIAILDDAWYP